MAIGDLEVTRRSYTYEIDYDMYVAIEDRDFEEDEWKNTLAGRIDQLDGVCDTDYNGHFGPYVFFSIDAEDDAHELNQTIIGMINDWAAGK